MTLLIFEKALSRKISSGLRSGISENTVCYLKKEVFSVENVVLLSGHWASPPPKANIEIGLA